MSADALLLRLLILVTVAIGSTTAIALGQGASITQLLGLAVLVGAAALLGGFGWLLYRLTRPWSPEPPSRRSWDHRG